MFALRRIENEYAKMKEESLPGIRASPGKDLFKWKAFIDGPPESPYEGGRFALEVHLPVRYPLEPPVMWFCTPVFHPNVNDIGEICLDILKAAWSPALSLQKVLLSVSALLADPNFADPLNPAACDLYDKDERRYFAKCKQMTQQYAMTERAASKAKAAAKTKAANAKAKANSAKVKARAKTKAAAKAKANPKAKVGGSKRQAAVGPKAGPAKARAKSKTVAKSSANTR
mmetsp:Transcript_25684/g.67189  ORF Transcript_25684/g.67189 Transcript_25684/m.67189 type:complete len:229 (-) Transcript_25684:144-830(-)